MTTNDINAAQKIEVGKMSFTVEDEYPDNVADDVRKKIEQELFNVFKKYENDDS